MRKQKFIPQNVVKLKCK